VPIAFGTSEHWHSRAEKALALAEQMTDPAAKHAMRDVAASYEKIARRAEALRARPRGTRMPPDA